MTIFASVDFIRHFPVSRETLEKLTLYAELLAKWQARINLVGPATLPDLWRRHMLDSAQLAPLLEPGPILDIGSGAGFPGLVLAIISGQPVHLVESDIRKGTFLREAARVTGAPATVHSARIEALAPFSVANITARALAPLADLLAMVEPFLSFAPQCLFLKGRTADEELTEAGKNWMMRAERISSVTDPSAHILRLREVHRGRE